MRSINQKKGAIEMSLNLIIMLIIGLTVLALVIGFVNNLINQGSSEFESQLSATQEREKQRVLDAPGAFVVGPSPAKLSSGGTTNLFVKVRNVGNGPLTFDAIGASNTLNDNPGVEVTGESLTLITFKSTQVSGTCAPNLFSPPATITQNEQDVIPIRLDTQGTGCKGGDEFFLTVEFTPEGTSTGSEVIFTQTLTVTVED